MNFLQMFHQLLGQVRPEFMGALRQCEIVALIMCYILKAVAGHRLKCTLTLNQICINPSQAWCMEAKKETQLFTLKLAQNVI